ncbi:MAG: Holliday junction resolvase RuvX [Gammaproteobacteria bacterium]|nr:Holliday junction resolvase RuvX [Gammaproteobacteria bacterium]
MPEAAPQLVLAFDFGLKRIGLASGESLTGSSAPLAAIRNGPAPDWPAIDRQVAALQPGQLVVGSPYNVDGSPGALSTAADRFAQALARRYDLPVARVDERYSSLDAAGRLKQRRASGAHRRRLRREDVDSAAAAVILERWFQGDGGLDRG